MHSLVVFYVVDHGNDQGFEHFTSKFFYGALGEGRLVYFTRHDCFSFCFISLRDCSAQKMHDDDISAMENLNLIDLLNSCN